MITNRIKKKKKEDKNKVLICIFKKFKISKHLEMIVNMVRSSLDVLVSYILCSMSNYKVRVSLRTEYPLHLICFTYFFNM